MQGVGGQRGWDTARLRQLQQAPEAAVLQLLAHVGGERNVTRVPRARGVAAQHGHARRQRAQRVGQERVVLQAQPLAVFGVGGRDALQLRAHGRHQLRVRRIRHLPAVCNPWQY